MNKRQATPPTRRVRGRGRSSNGSGSERSTTWESDLPLPHERDETPDQRKASGHAAQHGLRDEIRQAARDVRRGLRDTEARGIPSNLPRPRRK
jgi:hypothetical protein